MNKYQSMSWSQDFFCMPSITKTLWQIDKLTILLGVDGLKMHNMVAETTNSGRIGRIVWITWFFLCRWIFFVCHHIIQFETLHTYLALLYKPCLNSAVLISFPYIAVEPLWIEMEFFTIKLIIYTVLGYLISGRAYNWIICLNLRPLC